MQELNFLCELKTKLDLVLTNLKEIKENGVQKLYNTNELRNYLKVGKSVIERLRQNDELSYSRVGKSYIYTQQDVDDYLKRNHISYV